METQFRALSDPTRLKILSSLALGEAQAGDIAAAFSVTRPAISHHLRILSQAGLIKMRRKAQSRLYSIDPKGVTSFRWHFDQFWDGALDRLKLVVESDYQKEGAD